MDPQWMAVREQSDQNKQQENKLKTLQKVIQSRSWRSTDGEGKLEQMALEIDKVKVFLGKKGNKTSQSCCFAAGRLVWPDPNDGVWCYTLPREIQGHRDEGGSATSSRKIKRRKIPFLRQRELSLQPTCELAELYVSGILIYFMRYILCSRCQVC